MCRFPITLKTSSILSLVFAAALLPSVAQAQRGGGMAVGHSSAVASAPHVAMHAAPAAAAHAGTPHTPTVGHYVRTRSGTVVFRPSTHPRSSVPGNHLNDSRRVLSEDVPGLGFDYSHLAAISGGRGRGHGGHGRAFGSAGRDRNRPVLAYFPFFGGGYYLPLYDDYDDTAATEEQQAEASEPDYYPGYPGDYPPPPRPGDTPQGYSAPAPAQSTAVTAERPADEYVFVRRDGSLFFAVAYTWADGNLRYVTSEGLRRSVAGDTLDLDATQQFNEQRGLSFRVPSA